MDKNILLGQLNLSCGFIVNETTKKALLKIVDLKTLCTKKPFGYRVVDRVEHSF